MVITRSTRRCRGPNPDPRQTTIVSSILEQRREVYSFTQEALLHLVAGRVKEIEVGYLPHEVARHFETSKTTVYLSSESALKITRKHGGSLLFGDYEKIPLALQRGLWIADRDNSCCVSYYDTEEKKRFIAAVKITKDRRRSYLTTVHLASKRQTKSLLRRGPILRSHW